MDGAILAGGKSQRMGCPKPFVKLGDRPLISWVLDSLRPVCRHVFIIVADQVEPFGDLDCYKVVRDHMPNLGPMGGICTALLASHEHQVFVTACDTPFLNPRVVRYLSSKVEDYEVVVPKLPDGFHPLQAVYTQDCLHRLYDCLTTGGLTLTDFLQEAKVRVVSWPAIKRLDPQLISFFHIDTPQDLERASNLLYQRRKIGGSLL
jgi:molybdopterin-guanine dinucleotide biosynthesis protein A